MILYLIYLCYSEIKKYYYCVKNILYMMILFHYVFMNCGENGNFSIKLGIGPYFIIITYLNYHFDNK